MRPRITVVGSFVADLVVWLPRFPVPGETLLAERFEMFLGGKGFNQAVTAARCGADVAMVGRVGADVFGDPFLHALDREGVDRRFVLRDETTGTTLGIPIVEPGGQNRIIQVPRANMRLSPTDVDAARQVVADCNVLMIQLEVPVETSLRAAQIAREAGARVILNPAPARALPPELFPLVDWLVPNEVEVQMLAGEDSVRASAESLLRRGVAQGVVVTLGSQGALCIAREGEQEREIHSPAFPVAPVDPTGAGDAFCGALAVALAEGHPLDEALRFANAAGALSVTVAGAEPSLPSRAAIESMLNK